MKMDRKEVSLEYVGSPVWGPAGDFYKHGNETSGPTKCGKSD
jgi:hypothetical protein